MIFDKRGTGDSKGTYEESPHFSLLADDLLKAYNFILNRHDVDRSKEGFLGISRAAWVLPIALQNLNNVAFTIFSSCPTWPPYLSDLFQKGRQLLEEGYTESDIENILDYNQSVKEYVAIFDDRQRVIDLRQKYKFKKWFKDFK